MAAPPYLAPPGEPGAEASTPSFSVVIPAYQAARFVGQAIASALSQTHRPLEVIVVDDGSTDDIESAVDPYRDRITFLRKENGGEASAKNAGARAASGTHVAILDADDIFLPGRLEALADLATARPDLDILTTDGYIQVDGRVVRRCYTAGFRFETVDQRRGILERNFLLGWVAVRRERLLAVGGFDESLRFVTDWDAWIRLFLDGALAGLVTAPLARYRQRPGSLSSQRTAMMRGRVAVLDRAAAHPGLRPPERSALARSRARYLRQLALLEAKAALLERRADARRLSMAVALGRGHDFPSRVKAVGAALAPRLAGRRLSGREPGTRETTAELGIPGA